MVYDIDPFVPDILKVDLNPHRKLTPAPPGEMERRLSGNKNIANVAINLQRKFSTTDNTGEKKELTHMQGISDFGGGRDEEKTAQIESEGAAQVISKDLQKHTFVLNNFRKNFSNFLAFAFWALNWF